MGYGAKADKRKQSHSWKDQRRGEPRGGENDPLGGNRRGTLLLYSGSHQTSRSVTNLTPGNLYRMENSLFCPITVYHLHAWNIVYFLNVVRAIY